LKIKVTEENCKRGTRGSCYTCPVALGFKDAFPKADFIISVNAGYAIFSYRTGVSRSFPLPFTAEFWISGYDGGAKPLPFEFEFTPISVSIA